jgi:hypothetical protein
VLPSSTERNAMTSLHRNRIHGWIVPAIVALAAAFALALPGLARADDTAQSTAATPVTATATAGTSDSSANSVVTPTTSSTDTTTSTSDDTSATDSSDSTDPSDWGAVAQPDAASWR